MKPPTPEQIMSFIKELKITPTQFERYYSMSEGLIRQIRGGFRNLPVRFWPIVYEKIVPKYGEDYINSINEIFYPKPVAKKRAANYMTNDSSHPMLTNY